MPQERVWIFAHHIDFSTPPLYVYSATKIGVSASPFKCYLKDYINASNSEIKLVSLYVRYIFMFYHVFSCRLYLYTIFNYTMHIRSIHTSKITPRTSHLYFYASPIPFPLPPPPPPGASLADPCAPYCISSISHSYPVIIPSSIICVLSAYSSA